MIGSWIETHPTHFWRDRRVLITGCTGLVGSWLTAALIELGAHVVGLVRDTRPHSELVLSGNIKNIAVVNGDLSEYDRIERILAEYQIETVFHLAAQTIVGIAHQAPMSTFETNIRGTWLLLEAARRIKSVKRIVVSSSDTTYGRQAQLPYHEDAPLQGLYPYDVSKSCADLIARSYAHTYGLPVVVTRCSNLYGGGDLNWSRLIPSSIRSALRGESPVLRSDGRFKRDYLYVKDALRGYLLAAEKIDQPGIMGEAFNLGCETPRTAIEMVEQVIKQSPHPDLKPTVLNQSNSEVEVRFLSAQKAANLLGWRPQYTLEDGLKETMVWYDRFLTNQSLAEAS